MSVAVVGGGLAGISAAVALQEAGLDVDLYEARPRLGGATHSFQRGGITVDNGQHVMLRAFTAYRGLLDRRSAACTSAMAGIYSRLLTRIAADPVAALDTRMSLPSWEKAVVATRALAGVRP